MKLFEFKLLTFCDFFFIIIYTIGEVIMKAEYINVFIQAVLNVLDVTAKLDIRKKDLTLIGSSKFELPFEISAIIGMTGQLKGQVIYSMQSNFSKEFTAALLMGMPVNEIDNEMMKSGVNEMANMITGNATNILNEKDVNCELSIPSIMEGNQIVISPQNVQTIKLTFDSTWGDIVLFIALKE